ncbi:unnamed protein product, partial [Penicillium egyptiacum]
AVRTRRCLVDGEGDQRRAGGDGGLEMLRPLEAGRNLVRSGMEDRAR